MSKHPKSEIGLLAPEILRPAIRMAFVKLDPRRLMRNPVIFATALVALVTTTLVALHRGEPGSYVSLQIALWLWATVLFANFAEAVAEGRGKARADTFRATKATALAKVLLHAEDRTLYEPQDVSLLEPGTMILVEAGDIVPTDGEVVEGIASVDESAITGVSAGDPRIRWRSLQPDRRHAAGFGLAGGAGDRAAGRDLP